MKNRKKMWIKPGERCGVIFRLELHHSMEFLAGPMVRTPHFHYGSMGSIPGWGAKILQAAWLRKKKKLITSLICSELIYLSSMF